MSDFIQSELEAAKVVKNPKDVWPNPAAFFTPEHNNIDDKSENTLFPLINN